jgi:hypothetical protein
LTFKKVEHQHNLDIVNEIFLYSVTVEVYGGESGVLSVSFGQSESYTNMIFYPAYELLSFSCSFIQELVVQEPVPVVQLASDPFTYRNTQRYAHKT